MAKTVVDPGTTPPAALRRAGGSSDTHCPPWAAASGEQVIVARQPTRTSPDHLLATEFRRDRGDPVGRAVRAHLTPRAVARAGETQR